MFREEVDILGTLDECVEFGGYILTCISKNISSIPLMRLVLSAADIYGLYAEWEILNPSADIEEGRGCRRIIIDFALDDENDLTEKIDQIVLDSLEQAEGIFYQAHGAAVHGNQNAMVYTSLLYEVEESGGVSDTDETPS